MVCFLYTVLYSNNVYILCVAALCRGPVSVVLGVARALGRSTSSEPLFLSIFPTPTVPAAVPAEPPQMTKKKSFSNFRPIIPRSLSTTLPSCSDAVSLVSVDSDRDIGSVKYCFYLSCSW